MTGAAERRRRVRIAHVLPFPGVGGTELATLRLMQALRSTGAEGTALCLRDADAVAGLFVSAGFIVRRWRPRPTHRGRAELLRATLATAVTLWRARVDVVHLADLGAALPQVVGAARWLRKPVVCHVRNHVERLSPAIVSQLPHVRRFVFVSQRTWDTCVHAVPEDRGVVLYDGVESAPEQEAFAQRAETASAVRRELGLPPDAELVVMVARVEPQKDFATLARTAARVVAARPSAHFVVVGGFDRTPAQREHWPQVRQWIDAAGVAAHVHFVGFRDDVRRLLIAADVMLLVTHHEGLPLVLFEAMATATPIVATAVDGVPEAVHDGENGHLVAPGDDADAAARVLALLADRAGAERMGRAGRDRLLRTFSVARFAAAARAVYDAVLPTRGAAGPGRTGP